jgi:hypothetical protein
MPIFRICLNGKKMSTVGVGTEGVLSTHVCWARRNAELVKKQGIPAEDLTLDAGGLTSPTGEHVRWLDHPLEVGDEVRIKVIAGGPVDQPVSRTKPDPAADLRQRKRYVRTMAKQFGWKITSAKK